MYIIAGQVDTSALQRRTIFIANGGLHPPHQYFRKWAHPPRYSNWRFGTRTIAIFTDDEGNLRCHGQCLRTCLQVGYIDVDRLHIFFIPADIYSCLRFFVFSMWGLKEDYLYPTRTRSSSKVSFLILVLLKLSYMENHTLVFTIIYLLRQGEEGTLW